MYIYIHTYKFVYSGINETKQSELELLVYVFTIIQLTHNYKFTIYVYI